MAIYLAHIVRMHTNLAEVKAIFFLSFGRKKKVNFPFSVTFSRGRNSLDLRVEAIARVELGNYCP
jgi:hypothetical protein